MNISSKDNGSCEVRVRAQVMMRDDSTGGWVPLGGGGLSNVSVRKRKIHHEEFDEPCRHEYLIHGRRISDNSVVLSCTIKKDFEYNKVMPTFHHWKTGNKKFGLTFQTAADARAFDKGVRMAIQDLLEGASESSPLHQFNMDVGDDDVFMQLDLPVDKRFEPVSPVGSSSGRSPSPPSPNSKPVSPALPGLLGSGPDSAGYVSLDQIQYPPRTKFIVEPNEKTHFLLPEKLDFVDADSDKEYPYVTFPRREPPHEYSYPRLVDTYSDDEKKPGFKKPTVIKSDSCSSATLKTVSTAAVGSGSSCESTSNFESSAVVDCKNLISDARLETSIIKGTPVSKFSAKSTLTCQHCRKQFSPEQNRPGSCAYAPPDCTRTAIEAVSCLQCAKCLLYHCMSDTEGDYVHPCDCTNSDGHRTRRWIGLVLLSILVPCLCCYLPLMACYSCGKFCKVCGGKHQPS